MQSILFTQISINQTVTTYFYTLVEEKDQLLRFQLKYLRTINENTRREAIKGLVDNTAGKKVNTTVLGDAHYCFNL